MTRFPQALLVAALLASSALADDAADIEARNVDLETAYNSGDAAAVAALYTEDAVVLPPGSEPVEGREAIQAMWQGSIESGFSDLDLEAVTLEVNGDTAQELGRYSGTVPTDQGDKTQTGQYIVVWKKIDGTWRLGWDIWNVTATE